MSKTDLWCMACRKHIKPAQPYYGVQVLRTPGWHFRYHISGACEAEAVRKSALLMRRRTVHVVHRHD